MIRVSESAGRAVKVPVAQVDQTGFTLPTQGANTPPPALIQQGDFLAYWPISSTTDKTFGVVSVANLAAGTSTSTSTVAATGQGLAYAAAIVALFTTKANFLGVSETQFRLGETYDGNSQLNQATANTKDDIWVSCVALPTTQEVGAYVTIDGTGGGSTGAWTATLLPQQVSFTSDKPGSAGSAAVVVGLACGRLVERAPVGATSVKIRLLSQLVG